jgi:hypothetical protein
MNKTNLLLLIIVAISMSLILALLYDMLSDKRWEKSNPLIWDDFRGIPNPMSPYGAFIKTYLDYEVSYESEIIQGSCHYWVTEIKGISYMSKVESSVKEQSKDYATLMHEQGHFDLTQTFANKFTDRAESEFLHKKFLCPKNDAWQINNEVSKKSEIILNQISGGLQLAHEDYDSETNHGLYYEGQKKWNLTIKNLLN